MQANKGIKIKVYSFGRVIFQQKRNNQTYSLQRLTSGSCPFIQHPDSSRKIWRVTHYQGYPTKNVHLKMYIYIRIYKNICVCQFYQGYKYSQLCTSDFFKWIDKKEIHKKKKKRTKEKFTIIFAFTPFKFRKGYPESIINTVKPNNGE